MENINYLDFDIHIDRSAIGSGYRVRVVNSPAGQAMTEFALPFSEIEVENFVLRVGRTRKGVRRLESPEMEAARKFGGGLFEAVFSDEVRGRLRTSLNQARQQGAGLRFRMHLMDVPELADLPWEYLYDATLDEFLVLSVQTPLVRYLDLPLESEALKVSLPIKILVMISSPSDYPELDVEQEYKHLVEGLADLQQRGLVQLHRLEDATLANLQKQLRREDYHIFHFIGHGGFDQQAQDGVLLLEDEKGRGRPVSGRFLGTILHDQKSMRLAVLNACEGARASRSDPFSGVAHSLVQKGIPAVIAMQFEITDEAAITLAHEFYGAIADGYPVDASLAEARKAVFARNNDVEWGTPVLYMRSRDGRIFELDRSIRQAPAGPQDFSPARVVEAQPISPTAEPVRGAHVPATLPPVNPTGEPVEIHLGHTHADGVTHPETHRHTRIPWVAAVLGLVALTGVALVALGIIDPLGLLNPAYLNPDAGQASIAGLQDAQQVTDLPVQTQSLTDTPPPTPTDTLTTVLDTDSLGGPVPVIPGEDATGTPTTEPDPTDMPTDTPTAGPTPIGSGPGQIAFASDRSGTPQIWLVDFDGNNPVQITDRQDGACQPAWSPDGMQLAFVSPCEKNQDRYLNSALYVINVDGTGERQLTDGIGGDYDPSWAPNSSIVFTSDRENFTSIYVIDPAAGGEPVALTRNSNNFQPDWSPDGKQIAFTSTRLGIPKIFTMPDLGEFAEGGHQAKEFSRGSEYAYSTPKYSPDGEALMFLKSINPPDKNVLPELVGSKIADIGLKEFLVASAEKVGTIREADYSPDGNWIVFVRWPGINYDIYIMTANGSDQRQVTQDPAVDFDPAWRPPLEP